LASRLSLRWGGLCGRDDQLQKPISSPGISFLTPPFCEIQILLKLPFAPADEVSANSKKSRAGKEGRLIGPSRGKSITNNLLKGH